MRFDFATAQRILFGNNAIDEIGKIAPGLGNHALLVSGTSQANRERLEKLLQTAGISYSIFPVFSEPTVDQVRKGTEVCLREKCNFVISIGGGSAVDTGKAVAMMVCNGGDIYDYLEVVGRGMPINKASLPHIAIPTTAGTGTEATRNAVVASPEYGVKASLRANTMLPSVALVDPSLTYDVPPPVTASTGMDALAQVIEPYVSIRANGLVDLFCREGIQRAAHSLLKAYQNGNDPDARMDMAYTSLLGGVSLANAGLGAVHGFAAPIGGMFPAPHGAVCAILLPPVMKVNVRALTERLPDSPALKRYDEIAVWLTGKPEARANDGAAWIADLCRAMKIPGLHTYGIQKADLPDLVEKGKAASSMKANPLPLTNEELFEILEEVF